MKIVESNYQDANFHVERFHADTLHVTLTYPPYDVQEVPERCRYVVVNQESVRASDGVRVWYDFNRDGFVIEQNAPTMEETGPDEATQVDHWQEVFFAKSWALTPKEFMEDCDG